MITSWDGFINELKSLNKYALHNISLNDILYPFLFFLWIPYYRDSCFIPMSISICSPKKSPNFKISTILPRSMSLHQIRLQSDLHPRFRLREYTSLFIFFLFNFNFFLVEVNIHHSKRQFKTLPNKLAKWLRELVPNVPLGCCLSHHPSTSATILTDLGFTFGP